MPELIASALGWIIPALVVFGVTALLVVVTTWLVRRARRSPRARAAALADRERAGASLVRLDDAVAELELEVGLSGALYGGEAPTSLRRARLTAQHARDRAFEDYRATGTPGVAPDLVRKTASRIERTVAESLGTIQRARAEHAAWMQANVSAAQQLVREQQRLTALRASMGDPRRLVAELESRYAEDEWRDAARAAESAMSEADAAERILTRAAEEASDPSRTALADLAAAERSLRLAEVDARTLEETHRLVTQASQAIPGEFDAARAALRQAITIAEHLEPGDAARLQTEVRAITEQLDALQTDAARTPTRTIDRIARLRDRLDLALGDARTAQQRLRGARTALPGTLAAARAAIAQAEASVVHAHSASARLRLLSAQRDLADARQAQDPVSALDAARRAMREAEDAKALADYDRAGAR
ncbi:hypothetical protein [Microbacterium sp. SS28]|uniref:hypothetical protein n=1 Tax=Microbacterium sp. SS28 TaxID=2919948 RepID=UPI001FA96D59|nr:hypothetical protein [Microbacterium sp. SS28]